LERVALGGLSEQERADALRSGTLWQRARQLAAIHPGVDPGDVYHARRALELEPSDRLRRDSSRDDFARTRADRSLFDAFNRRGIRFLIVHGGRAA
jgi:hypothetical protein